MFLNTNSAAKNLTVNRVHMTEDYHVQEADSWNEVNFINEQNYSQDVITYSNFFIVFLKISGCTREDAFIHFFLYRGVVSIIFVIGFIEIFKTNFFYNKSSVFYYFRTNLIIFRKHNITKSFFKWTMSKYTVIYIWYYFFLSFSHVK